MHLEKPEDNDIVQGRKILQQGQSPSGNAWDATSWPLSHNARNT
jgi:hypothetical protein